MIWPFSFKSKPLLEKLSPISGKISVFRKGKGLQLVVGGLVQSVSLNTENVGDRVWGVIVEQALIKRESFKNVLILGLGGGTVAHLLVKKFPEVKIVGVEIDPVIVQIGREEFNLNKLKNLKIITDDAFAVAGDPEKYKLAKNSFDLVVVDLYLGSLFPQEFGTRGFLEDVRNLLSDKGVVVINRILPVSEKMEKELFADILKKYFNHIAVREIQGTKDERNFIFSGCKDSSRGSNP